MPGLQFQGVTDHGSAQTSYYSRVDQHNPFGLGRNVPFATGNLADSLEALVDGKFITLRISHPKGCHANGRDGRIDDPKAGWKGRGVWSAYGGRATNHIEGGKGTKPMSFEVLVDESIVRELDKSGFIEKIYKK
jgi:hypothetical protein